MSVAERYDANYQQIANDHVTHWRKTGLNPWQTVEGLAAHENMTVDAIQRHAAPGARILDVGCGMGDLLLRLGDYEASGCDIADVYVQIAGERGLNVVRANAENIPCVDDWFDLVVATDMLEHVLDLNAVLRELVRVLKPGGFLVLRVPDNEDLAPYLEKRFPYEFVHLRQFTEASLRLLLNRVFSLRVLEIARQDVVIQVVAQK